MGNNPKVTQISEIEKVKEGEIINLPPFTNEIPFVARLKRPSISVLLRTGKVPNALMTTATRVFGGEGIDMKKKDSLKEMYEVYEIIAEEALMEPSYKNIKDAGVDLTDDQLVAIYLYVAQGAKDFDSFRTFGESA